MMDKWVLGNTCGLMKCVGKKWFDCLYMIAKHGLVNAVEVRLVYWLL